MNVTALQHSGPRGLGFACSNRVSDRTVGRGLAGRATQDISGSRFSSIEYHRRLSQQRFLRLLPNSGDGGNGGGGAGGGGGGGGDDDGEKPKKKGIKLWKGWEDRVAADPQFVYKVFVEQVIGVGASIVGDMSSRPNWGLNELDFVFATLVVGSIVNFALMYLLAPTGAAAASTTQMSFFQKMFSESTLKAWGAPGGHLFEPGYGLGARLINFSYKGVLFALVGMCAGLIGTSTSNGLLILRKKFDPNFKLQNEPPNILFNAGCWSLHMGLSSNLRYQILNGLDMVLQPAIPGGVFKLFTSIVRAGNNMLGGITFVMLAKLFGVQTSNDAAPAEGKPAAAKA